jgi:hypothetical protein
MRQYENLFHEVEMEFFIIIIIIVVLGVHCDIYKSSYNIS